MVLAGPEPPGGGHYAVFPGRTSWTHGLPPREACCGAWPGGLGAGWTEMCRGAVRWPQGVITGLCSQAAHDPTPLCKGSVTLRSPKSPAGPGTSCPTAGLSVPESWRGGCTPHPRSCLFVDTTVTSLSLAVLVHSGWESKTHLPGRPGQWPVRTEREMFAVSWLDVGVGRTPCSPGHS